jgi:nitrogen fixation/metabolism regulation signal transduction histidine kinase
MGGRPRRLKYEHRILILGLAVGLAGTSVALGMLWFGEHPMRTRVFLTVLIALISLGAAFALQNRVVFPLRTLSNLLGALREGDYSLRARGARIGDVLGEVIWEANALADLLRERRLGEVEATALLRKILAEIDVAMFGFDGDRRLQLINDSAQRLLGRTEKELLGCRADELGLTACLDGATPRVVDMSFPAGAGRWELRRGSYREKGVSHKLVFLFDLTRTLHREERLAWQRLFRTLRHEINNSLTPIQSVADSLRKRAAQHKRAADWEEDLRGGLEIIAERSEALDRFIGAYSKLTRLPDPQLAAVDVGRWVHRVASLEMRMEVQLAAGPAVTIQGDQDQLEQLLINVVTNAVDASLQAQPDGSGRVVVTWRIVPANLEVLVDDDGPGVDESTDVFVPFYTSKEHGSGIGLALSRQIAEAHDGALSLENLPDRSGCRARLRLPLRPAST